MMMMQGFPLHKLNVEGQGDKERRLQMSTFGSCCSVFQWILGCRVAVGPGREDRANHISIVSNRSNITDTTDSIRLKYDLLGEIYRPQGKGMLCCFLRRGVVKANSSLTGFCSWGSDAC